MNNVDEQWNPYFAMAEGCRVEYERAIEDLDVYPKDTIPADVFYSMGLSGEAAEVLEKVLLAAGAVLASGAVTDKLKKRHRGATTITNESIALELGDLLWYLVREANKHGYTLAQIMRMNVNKLRDRQRRNAVHGEGDKR